LSVSFLLRLANVITQTQLIMKLICFNYWSFQCFGNGQYIQYNCNLLPMLKKYLLNWIFVDSI